MTSKPIWEMSDGEIEEMVSDDIEDSKKQSEIIEKFIKDLFPSQEMVGYEFHVPKGWIKINFKPSRNRYKTDR